MKINHTPTINSYGNINDKINEIKNSKNTTAIKPLLEKKSIYKSTDSFIPSDFTDCNNLIMNYDKNQKNIPIDSKNILDFNQKSSISIGTYNGEEIILNNMDGYLGSNLGIPDSMASKPGEKENEFEKRVRERTEKLTDAQIDEITFINNAFNDFIDVSNGKKTLNSISNRSQESLKLGLEKIGVDLNKPFSINGEDFYVTEEGNLDYLYIKQYEKRSDGKVIMSNLYNV